MQFRERESVMTIASVRYGAHDSAPDSTGEPYFMEEGQGLMQRGRGGDGSMGAAHRSWLRFVLAFAAAFAIVPLWAPSALAAGDANTATCPNEALTGFRTYLTDCRAYEMVSQPDKGGQNVLYGFPPTAFVTSTPSTAYFAVDGQHVLFGLVAGPGAATGMSNTYVAMRSAGGWTSQSLSPPLGSAHPNVLGSGSPGASIFGDIAGGDFSRPIFAVSDILDPGASGDLADVYERNPDGSFAWISHGSLGSTGQHGAAYVGRSADGSHVLFLSSAVLESAATGLSSGVPELYDRVGHQTNVVGILPATACPPSTECVDQKGAMLGDGYATPDGVTSNGGTSSYAGVNGAPAVSSEHAVSEHGSTIFFESPAIGSSHEVYVRQNGATTTEISLSQKTGSSYGTPASSADFQQASVDGSKVFFSSADMLTDNATTGGGLYYYDGGVLKFLTPDSTGAGFQGVIAASDDGSRVYFLASGQLVAGHGVSGQPNLYLYEEGKPLKFIATLSSYDQGGILRSSASTKSLGQVRTTPDGRYLVFQSNNAGITSYDNNEFEEVYRYDAEAITEPLVCVSCDPGRQPVASAALDQSGLPTVIQPVSPSQFSPPHNIAVSETGSLFVFFETAEPLVAQASNGMVNVYEWNEGRVGLISGGTGPDASHFFGASADGTNVFFTTYDRLVQADGDSNRDIYDARIGGGFPNPGTAPGCQAEGCHGAPSEPPVFSAPASQTLVGGGNLPPVAVKHAGKRQKEAKKKPKKRKRGKKSASRPVRR
jgi:hypothetical protein